MATSKTNLKWSALTSDEWIKITLTPDDESSYSTAITEVYGDKQVYVKVTPGGNGEIGNILFTCNDCDPVITKTVKVQRCGCTVETTEIVWNDTETDIGNCGGSVTVTITGTQTITYAEDECPNKESRITTAVTYDDIPANGETREQQHTRYYPDKDTEGHSTITITQAPGPCTDGCTCKNSITIYNGDSIVFFKSSPVETKDVAQIKIANCVPGTITTGLTNEEYFGVTISEVGDVTVSTKKENEGDKQNCTLTLTYMVNGEECNHTIKLAQSAPAATCGCSGFEEYTDDIEFGYDEKGRTNGKLFTEILNGDCINSSSIKYEMSEQSRELFDFYVIGGTKYNICLKNTYEGTEDYTDTITLIYDSPDRAGCTVERNVTITKKPVTPCKNYNVKVIAPVDKITEDNTVVTFDCLGGTATFKAELNS